MVGCQKTFFLIARDTEGGHFAAFSLAMKQAISLHITLIKLTCVIFSQGSQGGITAVVSCRFLFQLHVATSVVKADPLNTIFTSIHT